MAMLLTTLLAVHVLAALATREGGVMADTSRATTEEALLLAVGADVAIAER